MATLWSERGPSRLLLRGLLVLAGAFFVVASTYAGLRFAPAGLHPEAGDSQAVTESVSYWTPSEGEREALRPRSEQVRQTGDGLELFRRLAGPHSPRGDEFTVELGERWTLAEEPAAYASFPPTPLWETPPETVHVGVPWQTAEGKTIGGFDAFHRLHEVERAGLELVKYKAREPAQFLVDGDVVWFRSAERVAFVEPVSGTVVDYRDEETLWKAPLDRPEVLHDIQPPRSNREKVWEAVAEPTPTGQQQLAQAAERARADHVEQLAVYGLPLLLAGQGLLWAGLAGHPERWLGA